MRRPQHRPRCAPPAGARSGAGPPARRQRRPGAIRTARPGAFGGVRCPARPWSSSPALPEPPDGRTSPCPNRRSEAAWRNRRGHDEARLPRPDGPPCRTPGRASPAMPGRPARSADADPRRTPPCLRPGTRSPRAARRGRVPPVGALHRPDGSPCRPWRPAPRATRGCPSGRGPAVPPPPPGSGL